MKPGYIQTDVGLIPEDWRYLPLTKLARLESGHTPSKRRQDYWGGDIFWVSLFDSQGLSRNEIFNTEKTITEEGLNNSSARLLPAGTVVFSRTATVGKTSVLAAPMATSQDFANFICGQNLHNLFLVYLFRGMGRTWKTLMAGSIHNTIYMPTFKALKIPVPPLLEQKAIAEALSNADELIESLEQLLTKNRLIKQGAMQELLTGERRLPEFSGEWKLKRLEELATIQRGASPRPIDNPIWFDENSKVGWVRISDVTQVSMFLHETTQNLSLQGIQHSRPVASNSLIMSICATVGKPVITKMETCIHDGFVVFDKLLVDQYFLYYVLSFIEEDWSRHGQTGSQMNLNTGLINSTTVSVPPSFEEQVAISSSLFAMDNEIAALEAKLQKARHLKQGMMQELLTGRIRLV